jgi:hypothetical protein
MRVVTIAVAFVLFSVPLVIEPQQPGKVYRVGILTNKAPDPAEARLWHASDQAYESVAGSRAGPHARDARASAAERYVGRTSWRIGAGLVARSTSMLSLHQQTLRTAP